MIVTLIEPFIDDDINDDYVMNSHSFFTSSELLSDHLPLTTTIHLLEIGVTIEGFSFDQSCHIVQLSSEDVTMIDILELVVM